MEFLGHTGNYGVMSTPYPTTMVYYVVNFLLNTLKLQKYNTTDRKVLKAGELSSVAEYIISMKSSTIWCSNIIIIILF